MAVAIGPHLIWIRRATTLKPALRLRLNPVVTLRTENGLDGFLAVLRPVGNDVSGAFFGPVHEELGVMV